jgi:photosystem II stability/assembly factor-like uncharacterized protein
MRFVVDIECENEAMRLCPDIARTLRRIADQLDREGMFYTVQVVRDDNGNTVGRYGFEEDSQ